MWGPQTRTCNQSELPTFKYTTIYYAQIHCQIYYYVLLCTNTVKRCEEYVISLLEQCEDLREVETFLQTRQADNIHR